MNFAKVDAFVAGQEKRGFPSSDLTIVKDGEVVFHKRYGYANEEKTRETSDRDMYYLYSLSKVSTCVGALRAIERGLISLDDPVAKYIPAFADVKVRRQGGEPTPAETVMTVRHLFTMTGGLNYNLFSPSIRAARDAGITDTLSIVSRIAEEPLDFEPGSSYQYSLCHDVLAAVVEVASGMRFADYQQKEIFDPLGMTDTTYHMNEEQKSRLVDLYRYNGATYTAEKWVGSNGYILGPDYDSGGAGLSSTGLSYARLAAALSNGGVSTDGYVLLKPETVELMQKNQLGDHALKVFGDGRFGGYGWGLCCRTHIRPDISLSPSSPGECGWDSAANAYFLADPRRKVGIVYLTHVLGCNMGYDRYHPVIRDLVYEGLEG